jgi:hypothetical protein
MIALVSFLVVVTLALIIERIATVALTLTGLSRDAAKFQARSALTGTGFTTGEAEQVASHPARRRIIMLLMGIRSFELITGVSTLVLTFVGVGSTKEGAVRGLLISVGLVALGVLASSRWVDRHLSRLIAWALRRWTDLDVADYTTLLGLTAGHSVLEMPVTAESWVIQKRLDELGLPDEGVTVLAVRRADGTFVGAPPRALVVGPRDTLILYGRAERLAEISGRRAGTSGDQAHLDAMDSHLRVLQDHDLRERIRRRRRLKASESAEHDDRSTTDPGASPGGFAGEPSSPSCS